MGTEILRPQDCLMRIVGGSSTTSIHRNPSTNSSSSYGRCYHSNPNPNPQKFYKKTEQRKQPQQQHRYLSPPQSEKDTTTFVIRNGFRSSTPSTTKSVFRNESTTTTVKKVLKRGESVDNFIKFKEEKTEKLRIKRSASGDLSSGFSLSGSSESVVVSRSEVYAGNAFYCSPPPSSLPLPTFSIKKEAASAISSIDDSATKDLRRLLRLD